MNCTPSQAFTLLFDGARASALQTAEAKLQRAVLLDASVDGCTIAEWRARLAELLALAVDYPVEDASEADAIAALAPQWPVALFGHDLPEWFTDPAAAALADPAGPACVVTCSESEEDKAARQAGAPSIGRA